MSRSYRHTPIAGCACGASDKYDKRLANRRLRHKTNRILMCDVEALAETVYPLMREVSNVWDFVKDGKEYFGNEDNEDWQSKWLRK